MRIAQCAMSLLLLDGVEALQVGKVPCSGS